jgi:hypothetical protein
MSLGGEEEIAEETNRSYWEKRGTKATVLMADEMLKILKGIDGELELMYNKFYIGMAKNNKPFNFVIFRPRKQSLRVEPKLAQSQQIEEKLPFYQIGILFIQHGRVDQAQVRYETIFLAVIIDSTSYLRSKWGMWIIVKPKHSNVYEELLIQETEARISAGCQAVKGKIVFPDAGRTGRPVDHPIINEHCVCISPGQGYGCRKIPTSPADVTGWPS